MWIYLQIYNLSIKILNKIEIFNQLIIKLCFLKCPYLNNSDVNLNQVKLKYVCIPPSLWSAQGGPSSRLGGPRPPVEPSLSHSAVRMASKCSVWNGKAKITQQRIAKHACVSTATSPMRSERNCHILRSSVLAHEIERLRGVTR